MNPDQSTNPTSTAPVIPSESIQEAKPPSKKPLIITAIVVIILLIAGTYLFIQRNNPAGIFGGTNQDLWPIFEQYKQALSDKDLNAYNKVVYKDIPEKNADKFKEVAPLALKDVQNLTRAEFVNRMQDERQAIYSTNPITETEPQAYNYSRSSIMFIKDVDGSWKIVAIDSPERWSAARTGTAENEAELKKNLKIDVLDADHDGLTEQREKCLGLPVGLTCIETDPTIRDTNGDGLWDGINAALM